MMTAAMPGIDAHEQLAAFEQLGPLLQSAFQIIGNARGNQAATEFKARFASF